MLVPWRVYSCWLNQPIWKIIRRNWIIFPKVRGENKEYVQKPASYVCSFVPSFFGGSQLVLRLGWFFLRLDDPCEEKRGINFTKKIFRWKQSMAGRILTYVVRKQPVWMYPGYSSIPRSPLYTLQGTNMSHLGKRKIIFKCDFSGDMLVPWRVYSCWLNQPIWKIIRRNWIIFPKVRGENKEYVQKPASYVCSFVPSFFGGSQLVLRLGWFFLRLDDPCEEKRGINFTKKIFRWKQSMAGRILTYVVRKQPVWMYPGYSSIPRSPLYTLQGTNMSHLGKRKIIFKCDFSWDM